MSKCEICGRELGLKEDHRDCVIKDYAKCIEDLEQLQTQKAIECLKEVKDWIFVRTLFTNEGLMICKYIDEKIKELEGEKE